jgi:2-dehydropantoate 2-reductase
MLMPKKKILVYGAGSIGSYLAAKLYAAGHEVDVIGREKAKAIGDKIYINDEEFNYPLVYDEIDSTKKYNYIFVTSKYYDLKRNLETITNSGVMTDLIVLIQNTYIDNSWYINLIKNAPFVVVSVFEGFNLEGNKLKFIKTAGWFLDEDMLSRDAYSLLKDSDVNVQLTEDIDIKRAEKTVFNSASNVFSALEGKTLRELTEDRETLKQMQLVFDESYDIMSELIPIHSRRSLWNTFLSFVKNMDHYSTTYQDVKQNKRTEVFFLNGFIIELGRKFGIPTPNNLEIVKKFKEKYPELY